MLALVVLAAAVAWHLGLFAQARDIAWPVSVRHLVALAQNGNEQAPQVWDALERMDVSYNFV